MPLRSILVILVGGVIEPGIENDFSIFTHLRAAETQYGDFVPLVRFAVRARNAVERAACVVDQRVLLVRQARHERDVALCVGDRVRIAIECRGAVFVWSGVNRASYAVK